MIDITTQTFATEYRHPGGKVRKVFARASYDTVVELLLSRHCNRADRVMRDVAILTDNGVLATTLPNGIVGVITINPEA